MQEQLRFCAKEMSRQKQAYHLLESSYGRLPLLLLRVYEKHVVLQIGGEELVKSVIQMRRDIPQKSALSELVTDMLGDAATGI